MNLSLKQRGHQALTYPGFDFLGNQLNIQLNSDESLDFI